MANKLLSILTLFLLCTGLFFNCGRTGSKEISDEATIFNRQDIKVKPFRVLVIIRDHRIFLFRYFKMELSNNINCVK